MKKKLLWLFSFIVILVIVFFVVYNKNSSHSKNRAKTVRVSKGSIVEKALAVGHIEPLEEIDVKSKISGVVKKLFVDDGHFVHKGDPLLEIQPEPTPLELAEATRNVEMAKIQMQNLEKEMNRANDLKKKGLLSTQEFEKMLRDFQEAKLRFTIAREKLALIETGKVTINKKDIETIIRSPIDGYVLEKVVHVGDPVVPLTSYQAGTSLMKIADMSRLIFRGTVDEIDVGKLKEGMAAEIQIGALPGVKINGELTKISLKATKRENATVFPVEINILAANGSTLRAGYSANAHIIISKKEEVLLLPERVIYFKDDSVFVHLPGENRKPQIREIQVGLSDAVNTEIVSGLKENDEVLEKPEREIK